MKLPQLSFTTKIANYFLLLALFTVSIVGGVAYFRAREALKQAAFDRLRVAATLKEQEIVRWFEDRQRDFLHTTQMPDVQNNLAVLLGDGDRQAKENAYQVLSRYLADLSQIKPGMREICILDRSNKIVLSTNKKREGEYEILANITYVEKVEAGANFAPIFYVSPITRKPAITLAKPLANRSGMVLMDLDLERIDRIVREKTGLGKTGESYLVGSLISKNAFIAGKSQSVKLIPDNLDSPGIDSAMSGMRGYGLYRNYAGNSVLGVYRWLNEQDIALLVEISQAEALNPARELATAIVLVGSISALGLSVGVSWLSYQLFLSRQQLQVKAQEAEAANLAKSTFLANMSHELRTPLNAILGFSQLMARDRAIAATHQESLEIINRSGEHLLNLINDVLEMSKIEAGKITLNKESFDLHWLLDTIQAMFQIKAESKGLWFKFQIADSLPQYVVTDPRKLRQLLINLLSNAVKFTQTGGVSLKAFCFNSTTSSIASSDRLLCFSVIDTGRGIAPTELETLFDPFVQTASGMQYEGGTGLGLAISRQFVELMGGKITATSILDRGSTFTFQIPVELMDKPAAILSTAKQVTQLAPGRPPSRLAVIDDRPSNRLALSKLLEAMGFEVRTANNGKEAIALWQSWQPDLIWMDMRMPVMDGYAATRQIKQHPDRKSTVIIALTASAFAEQREKIIAAGCDDFVAKPFTERVIADKLQQHLGVKFTEIEEVAINDHHTAFNDSSSTIQSLSGLHPDLITRLHQAAIAVDAEQIEESIAQIPPSQHHIRQTITEMLTKYDFDGIIDLTETRQ